MRLSIETEACCIDMQAGAYLMVNDDFYDWDEIPAGMLRAAFGLIHANADAVQSTVESYTLPNGGNLCAVCEV